MKVGFVVWNAFQVYHMRSIAEHVRGPLFVVVDKDGGSDSRNTFGRGIADFIGMDFTVIRPGKLPTLDGVLDAMVCPNPIPRMEDLTRTKTFCMQYSMTKERYQYGPWRALFDGNLVYGPWSAARVSPLGPTRQVGNPRFDRWFTQGVAARAGIVDPSKPTVLYLPTWGEFSSAGHFTARLRQLQDEVNLLIKVHHKTHSHEADQVEALRAAGIQQVFGARDDLLELLGLADVVMSDFSGAIFDAIYVRKPVVLLQPNVDDLIGQKFGLESIEYARRDEIGPTVLDPDDLIRTVRQALDGTTDYHERNEKLREDCFAHEGDSGKRAAEAIAELLDAEDAERPYYSQYLQDHLRQVRIATRGEPPPGTLAPGQVSAAAAPSPTYRGIPVRPSAFIDKIVAVALGGFGLASLRAGRADIALKFLGKSVLVVPDSAVQWARVGDTRASMRHWFKAAAAYERSLAVFESGEVWSRLGTVLAQDHRWHESAEAFRRGIALDGSHPEWLHRLADILLRDNSPEEAQEVRERALESGPRAAGAQGWCPGIDERPPLRALRWENLAGILIAPDDKDWPAVRDSRKAATLRQPTSGKRHYLLGVADERMLDWPAAVAALERAVELKPGRAAWHHRLGKAREIEFDFSGAERSYREAIVLSSESNAHWNSLGRLYAKRTRWEDASRTMLGIGPDGSRYMAVQGMLSMEPRAQALVVRLRQVLESPTFIFDDAVIAEAIADARRVETGLSVEWWFALHWRLVFEGRFRLANEVKDIAAHRVLALSSGPITKYGLGTIANVTRAMAHLGMHDRAIEYLAQVAGPEQPHESLQQLAAKLTADLHMRSGAVEEAVTRLGAVPGLAAPRHLDDLGHLVEGKSVAIVGPAQVALPQGSEIDGFDVVMRSNVFSPVGSDRASAMGSRTDVAYYNSGVRQLGDHRIAQQLAEESIKLAVLRRPVRSTALAPFEGSGRVRLLPIEYRGHYRASCFGIQRMVYDLLPLRPRRIKIFNIDFFIGATEYEPGYKLSGADISFRGFSHDFGADFALTKAWFDAGAIEADDRVAQLLEMSTQEYLEALEGKL